MQGKVCVFGSFNVDIVARVERFPRGASHCWRWQAAFGPAVKAQPGHRCK
jgi:sugar/nucleoside kinase (ribokinase family)